MKSTKIRLIVLLVVLGGVAGIVWYANYEPKPKTPEELGLDPIQQPAEQTKPAQPGQPAEPPAKPQPPPGIISG